MAKIPKSVEFKGDAKAIINSIRNSASAEYRSVVPKLKGNSVEELRQIGDKITEYTATSNEFIDTLVNRIMQVIVTSKSYQNPWAVFKRGIMEFGDTIEELFVNLAKVQDYDPTRAESEVFKREIPEVLAMFHKVNYKKFYKVTVENEELRAAFTTWSGVEDLITRITESLYTSANYDEFIIMKYLLMKSIINGEMFPVQVRGADGEYDAQNCAAIFRAYSNKLTFMSKDYNAAGVKTKTLKENQYLIMSADFNATMDVEVLASAFNMDKADFMGHVILIDSFSEQDEERLSQLLGANYEEISESELEALKSVPAVLVDSNYFVIYDTMLKFTEQYNGQGLYWNYFYHVWKVVSSSMFANAVVFTATKPNITGITVSPASATISKGSSILLNASVASEGFPSQGVTWSSSSDAVIVNEKGLVTALETATGTATITATSLYDSTQTATATITIA